MRRYTADKGRTRHLHTDTYPWAVSERHEVQGRPVGSGGVASGARWSSRRGRALIGRVVRAGLETEPSVQEVAHLHAVWKAQASGTVYELHLAPSSSSRGKTGA